MESRNAHLVYYSAYLAPAGASYESILTKLIMSVESLRGINHSIPICLVLWGNKLNKNDRRRLDALGVEISHLGKCEERLKRDLPTAWLDVYSLNPSAGRWLLGLDHILARTFEQVLYVDKDTYFMSDVEELFSRCRIGDIYAREEPRTRESHLGYNPEYIDQRAIDDLVRSEKVNPCPSSDNLRQMAV